MFGGIFVWQTILSLRTNDSMGKRKRKKTKRIVSDVLVQPKFLTLAVGMIPPESEEHDSGCTKCLSLSLPDSLSLSLSLSLPLSFLVESKLSNRSMTQRICSPVSQKKERILLDIPLIISQARMVRHWNPSSWEFPCLFDLRRQSGRESMNVTSIKKRLPLRKGLASCNVSGNINRTSPNVILSFPRTAHQSNPMSE